MAQFDVYDMPSNGTRVVDIQSDLLDPLTTRVVVPLLPLGSSITPAKRLNPVLDLQGERFVFAVQFLAAVQRSDLGEPISSVASYQDQITQALDMLYQGF
ncbi:MAG: CcdB family protein [Pseudomonadota bacterium]